MSVELSTNVSSVVPLDDQDRMVQEGQVSPHSAASEPALDAHGRSVLPLSIGISIPGRSIWRELPGGHAEPSLIPRLPLNGVRFNPLPTNDAYLHHDRAPISTWGVYTIGVNTLYRLF